MSKYVVTHIIQGLSRGGGARATLYLAKYSAKNGNFRHRIVSLTDVDPKALEIAQECGVDVIEKPDVHALRKALNESDIVQISWWNTPEMYRLFVDDTFSEPSRLVGWFHVGGHAAPQILTNTLVDFFDISLACSPYTYSHQTFQSLPAKERDARCGMVYGATDFERIGNVEPRAHDGFLIGYIGTVDFVKMHPSFVSMSANSGISDARFLLCGPGSAIHDIMNQAKNLQCEEKFNYLGYVENLPALLSTLDVYGYPLREDTYAASEMNLQEVMYAGIPVVVLPSGGIKDLVIDGYTGIVARSEEEYSQALKFLYENPDERKRLGANAKKYATEIFGAQNAGKAVNRHYEKILLQQKKSRVWRNNSRLDPCTHEIPAEWLKTGHGLFLESLGAAAKPFVQSIRSTSMKEMIQADVEIAQCSEVMLKTGVSGYSEAFPDSWVLKYWQGVVSSAQGNYPGAINSFVAALERGGGDARIGLALLLIAQCVGEPSLVAQAEQLSSQMGAGRIEESFREQFRNALITK